MVKNISVRKLRSRLAHVLDNVTTHLDRYVISKRGKPEAILMCIDDYEGWIETLEIMSDKKAIKDIRESVREAKQGKVCSFEEVFGRAQRKLKKNKS